MTYDLSGSVERQLGYFDEHYDVVLQYHLVGRRKQYIGSKDHPRCRYCGETGPESFRQRVHAFPELIGNKRLIANDECDRCNKKFSTGLEDHFAKFLMPFLAAAQIRGKKGVPTIKSRSGKSRFQVKSSDWTIISCLDDPIVDMHDETNEFTFNSVRQPYIPMAVYKCLTKMAISVMPEAILPFFQRAITWISLDDHTASTTPMRPLICLETFTPGPRPYTAVHSILWTRKRDSDPVPYSIFVIAFGNLMFQIVVPSPEKDLMLDGKKISLGRFPEPFGSDYRYGSSVCRPLDLTSEEVRREEHIPIEFHYEFKVQSKLSTNSQLRLKS